MTVMRPGRLEPRRRKPPQVCQAITGLVARHYTYAIQTPKAATSS
jgi:hypothetical protein